MKCFVYLVVVLMALMLTRCDQTISRFALRQLSSVKGVCDAQCEALCQDTPDSVDECENLCQPDAPRKWVFNCEFGGNCTGYCSVLKKQSIPALYVPPRPVVNVLRDPHTKGMLLHWKVDNQTAHKVIYIIQRVVNASSVPTEDMWFTQGWTIIGTYFPDAIRDACIRPWFRVAAVSRYGSHWYSDPVQTDALDVAVHAPGPVRNISTSQFNYHAGTEEITFKLYWKEPDGWERYDIISYFWKAHIVHPCVDSISGQGVPVYFDLQSSIHDTNVQTVRMPKAGVGCEFQFQVVAYSRCNPQMVGQHSSIDVTIDCHDVIGYRCPNLPYDPPGNVHNISLCLVPTQDGPSVLVGWNPPTDMGSEGRIAQYHIRWGKFLLIDKFLGIGELYNTTTKTVPSNCTWTEIKLGNGTTNSSVAHGLQIIATAPGHGHVDAWVSPVKVMSQEDDWSQSGQKPSTILKDDNGVVIVLVPKDKGVRVYVTLPEKRSIDKLSGFSLQWGRLKNVSQRLSIEDKSSVFMPKNSSSVVLKNLTEKRKYGIKVFPRRNISGGNDVDDGEVDPEPELHFFTMPLLEAEIQTTDKPTKQTNDNKNPTAVTSLAVSVPVVVVVVIALIVYSKRRRKNLSFLERRYGRNDDGFSNYYDLNGQNRPNFGALTTPTVVADAWELPHSCIKLGEVLGTGAFGMVMKGQVSYAMLKHRGVQVPLTEKRDRLHVTVAVKMLQEAVDNRYYQDFVQEINLMKKVGCHVNIVSMLGCCTLREPVCLVVEHMALGDLLHYLKKIRHMLYSQEDSTGHYQNREAEHLTPLDLLSFARQIDRGMEFLAGKSFVHRDLAARNILVGENKVLKIGDFGLTRYIYDDKLYVNRRGGKLPVKWMSVEAIFDLTFSTASDVWSYGIVLFELMTLGGTPYPGIANRELLLSLRNGYRMERPDNCSLEMYTLMRDCWKSNPKDRPSFTDIGQRIDTMIAECSGQEYLDLQMDETQDYYNVESSEDEDSILDFSLGAEVAGDVAEDRIIERAAVKEGETSAVAIQIIPEKVLSENHRNKNVEILSVINNSDEKGTSDLTELRKEIVSLPKHSSAHLDIDNAAGTRSQVLTSVELHRRPMRGYKNDLVRKDRGSDPLETETRDRESESSYSQLEGSDEVFSESPLYTTPYSYLQSPSDLKCHPDSDSSPTESELSDGFFQIDSLGVTYRPRRFRTDRMASEVSTTSIDSGFPQSPIQTEFTGFHQHISRCTKNQPKTGQTGKTNVSRMTRNTSIGPSLPSVANSDEDLTSSSL